MMKLTVIALLLLYCVTRRVVLCYLRPNFIVLLMDDVSILLLLPFGESFVACQIENTLAKMNIINQRIMF